MSRDAFYLVLVVIVGAALVFSGWDALPASTVLNWALTFGTTTAAAVLLVSFYRVQVELKHSRDQLARKQAELSIARQVQTALFPRDMPVDCGLDFSAVCIPAEGISGDFYDLMTLPDGTVGMAVADISGKGLSAALLMSNLQARLRTLVEMKATLQELVPLLNRQIYQVTEDNKFATVFFGHWNPGTRLFSYVNAGHQIPLWCGREGNRPLEVGGPPIGLFEEIRYEIGCETLQPGDLLVIYSDGITEASDDRGEEFGFERLEQVVAAMNDAPLAAIQQEVLRRVKHWRHHREADDDMTLVLVRVEKGKEHDATHEG